MSDGNELITWGEFKRIVDAIEGITEQTPIEYIDFSWTTADDFRNGMVGALVGDDGTLEIC